MLGALVSHVCGELRSIGGAVCFDLGDIFWAETRTGFHMSFFRSFGFVVGLGFLFRFFFLEDGASNDRVRFRVCGGFFVLGFREIGGQGCNLIVV